MKNSDGDFDWQYAIFLVVMTLIVSFILCSLLRIYKNG